MLVLLTAVYHQKDCTVCTYMKIWIVRMLVSCIVCMLISCIKIVRSCNYTVLIFCWKTFWLALLWYSVGFYFYITKSVQYRKNFFTARIANALVFNIILIKETHLLLCTPNFSKSRINKNTKLIAQYRVCLDKMIMLKILCALCEIQIVITMFTSNKHIFVLS